MFRERSLSLISQGKIEVTSLFTCRKKVVDGASPFTLPPYQFTCSRVHHGPIDLGQYKSDKFELLAGGI